MNEPVPSPTPGKCIDCGKDATGLRCKACSSLDLARRNLAETAARDAKTLAAVDQEKLSGQRLAIRLGVSRTRARTLVRDARRRQAAREAAP